MRDVFHTGQSEELIHNSLSLSLSGSVSLSLSGPDHVPSVLSVFVHRLSLRSKAAAVAEAAVRGCLAR